MNFELYKFDPQTLSTPRLPGISAIMRIKNGAEFLREVIESHLPFFDEIVACYNDCQDNTAAILADMASQYPDKVRVFHYEPKVYPALSAELAKRAAQGEPCIHTLANYYNYALAQARFSVATKLDDDHLPISENFAAAITKIKRDMQLGQQKVYSYSGINLCGTRTEPLIYLNEPLVGTGDILFFPICPQVHFIQNADYEQLNYRFIRRKEYLGILYFHLKHLKAGYGFANLPDGPRQQYQQKFSQTLQTETFAAFATVNTQQDLIRQHGTFDYYLQTNAVIQYLRAVIARREAPLRVLRLQRLVSDLQRTSWQTDLLDWLRRG